MGSIQSALGRSKSSSGSGYHGPVPNEVWEVLGSAWRQPFSTQSNYARERSISLALVASLGWLSTVNPDGQSYGRTWRITREGLTALEHRDLLRTTP